MSDDFLTAVVIVGHVDHGKSTFIGRLLFDTNNLSPDRLADIKKASEEQGRRVEYAYVTDQFQEERDANVTIDTSQTFLKLDGHPFVIIDAPGHKEYLKNMITGATQAESAILMLDVNEGVREQTEKHAHILAMLGITKIAVMINKMDTVSYKEEIFRKFDHSVRELLSSKGLEATSVIPLSAYNGDNVSTRSSHMTWYRGPTAFEFLLSCVRSSSRENSRGELRFPVQLTSEINGEKMVLGRVEEGQIEAGESVYVYPLHKNVVIQKVLKYNESLSRAGKGESVALILRGGEDIRRGHLLIKGSLITRSPRAFRAHSFWAVDKPVQVGDEVTVECRTQEARARIEQINEETDGKPVGDLRNGDVALIEMRLLDDLWVETKATNESLSRVVFHKEGQVSGCGIVSEVMYG